MSIVHRTQFSVLEECTSSSRILAENVLDLRSRIESKLKYGLDLGLGFAHELSQESDLNSEDLQDAQFQAEPERYDTIIARAHDAAERDRRCREQELEINCDDIYSDSELSYWQVAYSMV